MITALILQNVDINFKFINIFNQNNITFNSSMLITKLTF